MADFPNVVLIVLDTMRKDILRLYGGTAQTPSMEALASEGIAYENCIASAPWTVPSHASLFTGLLPSAHGVHETRAQKISEIYGAMAQSGEEPLAEYLRKRGYDTAGYSANGALGPGSGFESGFSTYQLLDMTTVIDKGAKATIKSGEKYGRSKWEITKTLLMTAKFGELARLYRARRRIADDYKKKGFPRLKRGGDIIEAISSRPLEEPFFLFVNFCEAHEPYIRPKEPGTVADIFAREGVDNRLLKKIRRAYLGEAAIVDRFVGSIVQDLRARGSYGRTLFVVTSDHGQALKEHGYYGHGTYLYNEILEVPLIVKYPGGKKPRPPSGYQPLARIPELVKDSLLGLADSESVTAYTAVAESFGSPYSFAIYRNAEGFEPKNDKIDRPRKAAYGGRSKLVIDGTNGEVEEFTVSGAQADPLERRKEFENLRAALAELRDPSFILPD